MDGGELLGIGPLRPSGPSLRDIEEELCSKPCAFLWGHLRSGFCSFIGLSTLSSVLTDFLKGRKASGTMTERDFVIASNLP
jgi:hypothetical protein